MKVKITIILDESQYRSVDELFERYVEAIEKLARVSRRQLRGK